MLRLFAAIAMPAEIAEGLARRQSGLEGARWRTAEQLHLTLRFFGDVREDIAEDLDAELAGVGGGPFEVVLEGSGAFGDGDDIHAVWAGVQHSPPLRRLAKACETAARRVGLPPDRREYRPHVTLAYLKYAGPQKVAAWTETHARLLSPPIQVLGFGLYSSHLGANGSIYRLEAEYSL